MNEYLCLLRLTPRLHDPNAWTPDDEALVSDHFERLQGWLAEGRLILAGRTQEAGERALGLVIFRAEDKHEAELLATSDPAVVGGVMTAECRPYRVALMAHGDGAQD